MSLSTTFLIASVRWTFDIPKDTACYDSFTSRLARAQEYRIAPMRLIPDTARFPGLACSSSTLLNLEAVQESHDGETEREEHG